MSGGNRLAIIAGSGSLPLFVANAARERGEDPFIIRLRDDSDVDWQGFDNDYMTIADVHRLKGIVEKNGIKRVVLSGAVKKRPEWNEIRPTFKMLLGLPSIIRTIMSGGDDAVLKMVVALLEAHGLEVQGAHEIAPNILVSEGAIAQLSPSGDDMRDIKAGIAAARVLGELDIGQGAVCVGARVVALEGAEGTDLMLERVAMIRAIGRISQRRKGVLVKLCKPQQEMRADLPTVGPSTVINAHKAGLAGIAIEAGRAFILEREAMVEKANELGIFIYGISSDELDT